MEIILNYDLITKHYSSKPARRNCIPKYDFLKTQQYNRILANLIALRRALV